MGWEYVGRGLGLGVWCKGTGRWMLSFAVMATVVDVELVDDGKDSCEEPRT